MRNGSDDWMRENGFMPPAQLPDAVDANDAYKGATVADLKLPAAITIKADVRLRDAGPAAATPGADVGGVGWRAGAQPQTTAKEAIAIMRDKGMDCFHRSFQWNGRGHSCRPTYAFYIALCIAGS